LDYLSADANARHDDAFDAENSVNTVTRVDADTRVKADARVDATGALDAFNALTGLGNDHEKNNSASPGP
jgi:hypothetical protein